tara:strand:- start:2273 stop:2683 length:411 start_codon:yes stop_codon:yes gene_type:complete
MKMAFARQHDSTTTVIPAEPGWTCYWFVLSPDEPMDDPRFELWQYHNKTPPPFGEEAPIIAWTVTVKSDGSSHAAPVVPGEWDEPSILWRSPEGIWIEGDGRESPDQKACEEKRNLLIYRRLRDQGVDMCEDKDSE